MFQDRFYDLYFDNLRYLFKIKNISSIKIYHKIQEMLRKFCYIYFLEKVFYNLVKLQKNDKDYQNWQILTNENAN